MKSLMFFKGKTLRFPMKPHNPLFFHPKCFDCQNAQFVFLTQMIKMSNSSSFSAKQFEKIMLKNQDATKIK